MRSAWFLSVGLHASLGFGSPTSSHATKREISQLRESYDFIIAGAGTAGLTVADRLSQELPDKTVLVVEYGDIEYAPGIFDPPTTDWNGAGGLASSFLFRGLPSPNMNNNTAITFGGKVVGGSSCINGMFFDRGSRFDYDAWASAQAGDPQFDRSRDKWNWDAIYPFFKKSVTFTEPTPAVAAKYGFTWNISAFGGTTPIYATIPPFMWGDNDVARNAWKELGVKVTTECAGGDKEGICWAPNSQHPLTGRRSHAGLGHYADIIGSRSNYDLLVKHQVIRVVYPGSNAASGPPLVEIRAVNGTQLPFNLTAKAEVIISAGVFHSPTILQRSGIGPSSALQKINVTKIVDLPGVGSNLQDHSGPTLAWNYTLPAVFSPSPNDMKNATFAAEALRAFNETPSQGPYTLAMGNSGIFISLPNMTAGYAATIAEIRALAASANTTAGLHLPAEYDGSAELIAGYKHQLNAIAGLLENPRAPSLESVFATGTTVPLINLHALSRGTVRVNPDDVFGLPIIDYRSGSNPIDFKIYLAHVRFLRKMLATPTMQKYGTVALQPVDKLEADDELVSYVKSQFNPSFMHPCCTSAMLPRARGGVVGPDLTVHGAAGLRVVDASVYPFLPSTHLSATTYALGEKAADIIIRHWSK